MHPARPLAIDGPTILHARTRRLYDYWLSRSQDRRRPTRADLDPVDFAFVLGNVILMDVGGAGPDEFRYRLVGSNCVRRQGYDPTGQTTAAIAGCENRRGIEERLRAVVRGGEPAAFLRQEIADHRSYRYEILYLPLGEAGRIDMIMVYLNYDFDRAER
jgi:hypothetical protein